MDSADPLILQPVLEPVERNPVTRATRAVGDKIARVEANVLNLPLTSVMLSVMLGAGTVALAVLIGRALEPRVRYQPPLID